MWRFYLISGVHNYHHKYTYVSFVQIIPLDPPPHPPRSEQRFNHAGVIVCGCCCSPTFAECTHSKRSGEIDFPLFAYIRAKAREGWVFVDICCGLCCGVRVSLYGYVAEIVFVSSFFADGGGGARTRVRDVYVFFRVCASEW